MRTIYGREPAVFVAMLVALLQSVALLFPFTLEQQGAVNAGLFAVGAAVTAILVRADKVLPVVVGGFKAIIAVLLAFGLNVPSNWQVGLLAVVGALGAFFVRQNVVAPVPGPADRVVVHNLTVYPTGGPTT